MRLIKRWRIIFGVLLFFNIVSAGCILYTQYKARLVNVEPANKAGESLDVVWMTNRDIPANVDLGSYLAAFSAFQDQQWEIAADKYLRVLATDPENHTLGKEAYLLNVLMGRLDKIEDLVKSLNSFEQPGL